MKKLKRILGVLVIGGIVLVIGGRIGIGLMWKSAFVKYGTELAEVPVSVRHVWINPFSGRVQMDGLSIGNPDGFKSKQAIAIDSLDLRMPLRSLFADKRVIQVLLIEGVEVTYERALLKSNLGVLSETIKAKTSREGSGNKGLRRQLQVDQVTIDRGKVNMAATLLGGRGVTLNLPKLELRDLGQDGRGITVIELVSKILRSVMDKILSLPSSGAPSLPEN